MLYIVEAKPKSVCRRCHGEYAEEEEIIRKRTSTLWCCIGILCIPFCFCWCYPKEAVRHCPRCQKPLFGTYWC